jgi:glycosyltransferase involved in cell wall biosynthesis
MLSPKGAMEYCVASPEVPVTIFPAGINRLPVTETPEELRWRPGALRLLYVGRFAPEKNAGMLIRALRTAVDNGVDAHLTMVGGGSLRDRYLAEGRRLGVDDRLTVLGPYPRGELGGIYADADVFVFPSMVDTQAFVLNEAAHEGLPLLVSDTVNSVVEEGTSAVVVPPDPDRYAEGFALLQDHRLRQRLGSAAKVRAEQVGEAAQCARLAEVIRRAMERAPAPGRSRSSKEAEPTPAPVDELAPGVATPNS